MGAASVLWASQPDTWLTSTVVFLAFSHGFFNAVTWASTQQWLEPKACRRRWWRAKLADAEVEESTLRSHPSCWLSYIGSSRSRFHLSMGKSGKSPEAKSRPISEVNGSWREGVLVEPATELTEPNGSADRCKMKLVIVTGQQV